MAQAKVFQRSELAVDVLPYPALVAGAIVDVVAKMAHQIELFFRHVLVRCVQAAFKVLTRGEREFQFGWLGIVRWHRPQPADRTLRIARAEAVPIPTTGLEVVGLNVYRMT